MTEREIARAQDVELWKDEKTQEKKMAYDGYL